MNPELVRKFFEGNCSPEEVHKVLLWINSEEGVSELQEKFADFDPNNVEGQEISQSILNTIHERIAKEEVEVSTAISINVPREQKNQAIPRNLIKWKMGIAASFLLILMVSAVWLFSISRVEKPSAMENIAQIEFLTRETLPGEKLTLKLNDGSIIHMNSNSKIRFPKTFVGAEREVFMQGQIFFDVHRDETRPFIVHSEGLTTSVLGTSFAIQEDSSAQKSEVSVLTGKVKVAMVDSSGTDEMEEIYLDPMHAASLDRSKGSFEKIKVDYDKAFAWKDNVLVFQNVSFEEVLKKLENWYGVKFTQKRRIKGFKDYSGRFDNQTLEEILIGLSFTYDFEFEIQGSQVIIN